MNQYIIPLPHNDPRLFSHVSHAFSLVDLGKRLLDAAKNGDVDEVTNLMGNGAPFTTDWLGISPLHFAAMNGHLSSCEALLQAGISRDARTKVDRTPLHLAAQEGHADIVELLLRNGADLDAKDMLRMTALHWAAERGHAPVVQMLMRFGANAHLQNKFEMTPLDIAESKGHTDARDAMLVCQDMAGCNGDLVHTNAYILTDEETLVPAAPPADEVTVTATTVEEEEEASKRKRLDASKKEPQLTDRELLACKDSNPDSCHVATGSIFINQELSRTDGIDKVDGSRPTANDDINQDDGQDVMLVETPDGEKLFVRQQYGHTGPESLAIFTNTGEKVDDPSLLNQVIEAMCTLPRRSDLDETEMDGVTMDIGCYTSSDNPVENAPSPSQNPSRFRELDSLKVDESGDITHKTTARSLNAEHMIDIKPFSVSNDLCTTDDPNPMTKQPTVVHPVDSSDDIAEGDCTNSLVHQLAAVINDPTQRDRSICVEGVGLHASSESLYLWCLYNKLYIRNSTDDNHFVVKFEQNETMYTMSASYDPNTGIVVFDTCVE